MTFLADGPGASIPLHSWWYKGPGGSSYSDASDFAFMTIFWYSVVWFVALFAITTYFVVKYRRKEGQASEVSPQHNTKIELIWTVLPSLTLVVMFVMGFRGYSDMLVPKGGGLDCDLLAQKWSWSLKYPTGGSNTESLKANELASTTVPIYYFPEETPVKLRLISKDVMHALWVPDFRAKVDILPNRYTKFWFESGKIPAGAKTLMFADITDPFHFLDGVPYVDHAIHCAEYCGDFHSDMAAVIRIIPKDAFAEWLKKGDAALPPVQRGQKIWETNCQTCHSIDGTLRTGPSWKDLFGRTETMTDGSTVVVDDNYTRESIYEPQKRIVGGFGGVIMPTFAGALDADQINALIAYMKSISVNAKEEPDPADPKPDAKPGDKPGDKPEAKPDAKPEAKPAETPKAEPKK